MNAKCFRLVEQYMLKCMKDSAHDKEHIYRVLYVALDIAEHEDNVDDDVLAVACLLHDIGREEEFIDPSLDHAIVGAEKATKFLMENGFSLDFAEAVSGCIKAHRFQSSIPPHTIEEKILFDSDKVDCTGVLGIARTIFYQGAAGIPLYIVNGAGEIFCNVDDERHSFFREYKFKLEGLYSKFYTKRAEEIALQRQNSAKAFYENMLSEIGPVYGLGKQLFAEKIMS